MAYLGRRRASPLAGLSLGLLLTGCQQLYELEELNRPDPETQAEAGSTHAFGVAYPWRAFVDALQPTFPMTPELALSSSLPTTASFAARTVEAFQAQLGVGLPRSTFSETETRKVDAEGNVARTEERTRGTTSGEAPTLPAAPGAPSGAATLPVLAQALQREPFFLYSAANDLFQEVQILNRAIRELPVGKGMVPYLVRLKVSPLAHRRQLGFDIFSDIVFFNEKPSWARRGERAAAKRKGRTADGWPTPAMLDLPYVVPLLVTDDVELASDAVTAEALLGLAAAVTGTAGGVGVGGQAQALRQSLNQALANRANALRTVVRLGDNSLRVRLGASYRAGPFGTKAYEQNTRTHNVSLLLLVPEAAVKSFLQGGEGEQPRVRAVALTSLRNVKTGELLPVTDWDREFENRDRIRDGFKLPRRIAERRLCDLRQGVTRTCSCRPEGITDACVTERDRDDAGELLSDLRDHSLNGRFDEFVRELRDRTRGFSPEEDLDFLWSELAASVGSSNVAVFTVPLPAPPPRCLPDTAQLVVLRDDKKATVAQISGVAGYQAGELKAALTVPSGDQRPLIPQSAVAVAENLLTVSFPSLNALGLVEPPATSAARPLPKGAKLAITAFDDDEECDPNVKEFPANFANVRYVLTEPAKDPRLKQGVVRTATIAAAADGTGQVSVGLDFELGNPPRRMLVWAENAEITAASSGQLDPLGRVRVDGPGYVTLTLRNLAPGTKVEVKGAIVDEKDAVVDGPKPFGAPVVTAAPGLAAKEDRK
jgi:hypothetical protein